MPKQAFKLKEYGGLAFTVMCGTIAAAITYGAANATTSTTVANHESRIITLEQDDKEYGQSLARMDQKITDIWHDLGHKDNR